MGKMNMSRVILGGIVAGVVADILGFFVDGLMLGPRWDAAMRALGHSAFSASQIFWFNVLGLVSGIVAVWIYAGIRPRFGGGVRTAVFAGVAVWIVGSLLPNLGFMYIPHLFPRHLTVYTTAGALIEMVVGTIAGAAIYWEAKPAITAPVVPADARQTVRA